MPDDDFSKIFYPLGNTIIGMKGHMASQRALPIIGRITPDLLSQVVGMLLQFDYQEIAPIRLLINSEGGDVETSFYLKDVIAALNSPVDGIVLGKAASMAVDILQMCRKRLALPHSRLYCHFTRCGFQFIGSEDEISPKVAERIAQRAHTWKQAREQLYIKRTGKTVEEVRELFRLGELYNFDMSAEEALEEKLIDEIIPDFKLFPERHKPPNEK